MSAKLVAAVCLAALFGLAACDTSEPLPPGVTTTTTRAPPPPPPGPAQVQEVDECAGLVEIGELLVENMIAALESGLSIGVLTGEEPAPPQVQLLRDVGRELDRRATVLGCEVGELNQEIAAAVADIESNDPVVALFLDIVRSGVISFMPEVPAEGAGS